MGPLKSSLSVLILAVLPLLLTGCDNPACVFGPNGCQQQGNQESLGSAPATVPSDGAWIVPTKPVFQDMVPTGTEAHPETPIAITFSESLNPASVHGSFEIIETTLQTQIPNFNPPPVTGDGRVVILSPVVPLQNGGNYMIRYVEGAEITDLTGQVLDLPEDRIIGSFSVAQTTPTTPILMGTFPADFSAGASDIGEMVAIFDRPMDDTPANPFDTTSWRVTVNGVPPANNPDPEPLVIIPEPATITLDSVWTWESLDSTTGKRVSLGPAAEVEVELSLPGSKLVDEAGEELAASVFAYDTQALPAPFLVEKGTLSDPPDAIGRPNLLDVVPVLQVQLTSSAQADDQVELFFFGDSTVDGSTVALSRVATVTAPTLMVDLLPGQLQLLPEGQPAVADGNLHVGARMIRGGQRTAIRMLDLDPETLAINPLLYDVTAPQLLGLGADGSGSVSFSSDLRNLTIVGVADEEVTLAEVTASTGDDNGLETPVILSTTDGLFAAAPVNIGTGVLDPGTSITYTVRVFDRALNVQAAPLAGTYFPRGTVFGSAPEGGTIDVRVYDELTLAPVVGASVEVIEDDGATFTSIDTGFTDGTGFVNVNAAGIGNSTIVVVDHVDYGLWSFQGVPTDSLQVPLLPSGNPFGTSGGTAVSFHDLSNLTQVVADSRRPDGLTPFTGTLPCSSEGPVDVCPYGPGVIRGGEVGAQTYFAADFDIALGSFNPTSFLRAFETRLLIAPINGGGGDLNGNFLIQDLLALASSEEQPIATPTQSLADPTTYAPDLGVVSEDPIMTVEALSPAIPDGIVVGTGVAFDTGGGPGPWTVLGAYPGIADGFDDGGGDLLGSLVTGQTLEADQFLRIEVNSDSGQVGARPRISNETGTLTPIDLPRFVSPGSGGSSGANTFDLITDDVIPDALGMDGIYRVVLVDSTGRTMTIWTLDPAGSADAGVSVRVPAGLAAGPGTCAISAFAWTSFDPTSFLWSDVDREHEVFAHTPQLFFTID